LAVDLQGLLGRGAMALLSGCSTRIWFGNGRQGSTFCYTHRVSVATTEMHAVDRYLLVAAACGASVRGAPEFRLRPLPADRQEVAVLLGRHGLPARGPRAGGRVAARWPTNRWPTGLLG